MKYFTKLLILLVVVSYATLPSSVSAIDKLIEGKDFEIMGPRSSKEPMLEEFFNYACGGCYSMESFIEKTKSDQPSLRVKQIPVELRPSWEIYVKAYHIGELLKVLDKSHKALFHRIHVEKKHLKNEQQMKEFFVSLGVEPGRYDKVSVSFALESKVMQSKSYAKSNRITQIPILLVNKKYKLNAQSLGSYNRITDAIKTLSVANQ